MDKFDYKATLDYEDAAYRPNPAKGGMKFDNDKPRMHLFLNDMNLAVLEVGKVATFGAKKYADRNWRKVDNLHERYSSALYRHLLEDSFEGGDKDSESGILHAAHAAWCALARLQILIEKEKENGNG
jgi:hypothetical protein